MAGRRHRGGPRGAAPPVPFVLALAGRPAGPGRRGEPEEEAVALRVRQAGVAEELARLEQACWRGRLDGAGLARLQALCVVFASLERSFQERIRDPEGGPE